MTKDELKVLKTSKQVEQLQELLTGAKEMRKLYDVFKQEGFTDEFIAIYLAHLLRPAGGK